MQHLFYFMKHFMQLIQRQKLTIFAFLSFPFVLIMLALWTIIPLLSFDEHEPIRFAIVDEDQSSETKQLLAALTDGQLIEGPLHFESMSKEESENAMRHNTIGGALQFPTGFTRALYDGKAIELHVIGNDKKQRETELLYSLAQTVAQHINTSQANILLIDQYAKEAEWSTAQRDELLFEQFMSYSLFTLGKDAMLEEEKIVNPLTDSPVHYFAIQFLFGLLVIWTWLLYRFFHGTLPPSITMRLQLLNVSPLSIESAKGIVITFFVFMTSFLGIIILLLLSSIVFVTSDVLSLAFAMLLTINMSFFLISIMERFRFLATSAQVLGIVLLLGMSGFIVPPLYLPAQLQPVVSFSFLNELTEGIRELFLMGSFSMQWSVSITTFGMLALLWLIVWRQQKEVK